jgi:hypothetical protein
MLMAIMAVVHDGFDCLFKPYDMHNVLHSCKSLWMAHHRHSTAGGLAISTLVAAIIVLLST